MFVIVPSIHVFDFIMQNSTNFDVTARKRYVIFKHGLRPNKIIHHLMVMLQMRNYWKTKHDNFF